MDSIKGKKEFDVSYIFVKEERDMNIVMKELEEHTFADVAASYSQDPGSKSSGGRIGWVLENSLTNEFSSVIKKLPINKLSKPFKTETGWYVMLKTGERDAVIPEFENAKASVRNAAIRDFLKNYSVTNTENLGIKLVE
jgi:parvulin-like peptidyl-prolyl isomerase